MAGGAGLAVVEGGGGTDGVGGDGRRWGWRMWVVLVPLVRGEEGGRGGLGVKVEALRL
jgi:hypothetical protein